MLCDYKNEKFQLITISDTNFKELQLKLNCQRLSFLISCGTQLFILKQNLQGGGKIFFYKQSKCLIISKVPSKVKRATEFGSQVKTPTSISILQSRIKMSRENVKLRSCSRLASSCKQGHFLFAETEDKIISGAKKKFNCAYNIQLYLLS